MMSPKTILYRYLEQFMLFVVLFLMLYFLEDRDYQFLAISGLIILVLLAFKLLKGYSEGLSIPVTGPLPLLLSFFLWTALSISWSQAYGVSTLTVIGYVIAMGGAILGFILDREQRQRYLYLLLFSGYLLIALTIFQAFTLEPRGPHGLFPNKNNHAALLNFILFITWPLFLAAKCHKTRGFVAPLLLLLSLSVALTSSRGAFLGLVIGVLFMSSYVLQNREYRRVFIFSALLVASGYFIGNLLQDNMGLYRLSVTATQFSDLLTTGGWNSQRALLWASAWEMFLDQPILGIGIGSFFYAYPAYRSPLEHSAGSYVHNDFLQLLLELGPLGLLLVIALMISILVVGHQIIRLSSDNNRVLQTVGAVAALAAVTSHSIFTFNLYLPPILFVIALAIGMLTRLAFEEGLIKKVQFTPSEWFTQRGYQLITVFGLALPALFFIALFLSSYYLKKIETSENAQQTINYLNTAHRLFPHSDLAKIKKAAQIHSALVESKDITDEVRNNLVDMAITDLDEALLLMPLRSENYRFRGDLLQHSTRQISTVEIIASYTKALELNPRNLVARNHLTNYLLQIGENVEAKRIVDAANNRYYFQNIGVINRYFSLAIETYEILGYQEQVENLNNIRTETINSLIERKLVKAVTLIRY